MNSDREGVDDSRPCGCTQDCDCDGPNPLPLFAQHLVPMGCEEGDEVNGSFGTCEVHRHEDGKLRLRPKPGTPECICEEDRNKRCPIHGFCPECSDCFEDGPCSCNPNGGDCPAQSRSDNDTEPYGRTVARAASTAPAQQAKAFAALSSMPSAPWMQIGDLVHRLRRFGHSDQWAADMAREWMKEHSKLVGR